MNLYYSLNTGVIAEWLSLIDPSFAKEPQFEKKLSALLHTQFMQLITSDETELTTPYWILKKQYRSSGDAAITFALIAYSRKIQIENNGFTKHETDQLDFFEKEMKDALDCENYRLAGILLNCIEGM